MGFVRVVDHLEYHNKLYKNLFGRREFLMGQMQVYHWLYELSGLV